MTRVLPLEKRILNHLILNSFLLSDTSLMYGKTGIAIAFYQYGIKHDQRFHFVVHDLLENIEESLYIDELFSFESGLLGVAWGVNYLILKNIDFKKYAIIPNKILDLIIQYDLNKLYYSMSNRDFYFLLNYILIQLQTDIFLNQKTIDNKFLVQLSSIIDNESKSNLFKGLNSFIKDMCNNCSVSKFFSIKQFLKNKINFSNVDILLYPLGIKNGLSNYLLFN